MDFSIKFKADLDQAEMIKKFNVMLTEFKKSLGSFGTGVKVLDEKAINSQFQKVTNEFTKIEDSAQKSSKFIKGMANEIDRAAQSGSALGKAFMFSQVTQAVGQVTQALQFVAQAGIDYESSLAAVGAITGLTGDKLAVLGDSARNLAKEFGGSASSQLDSFQGILSKLGPQLADTPEALGLLAKNINILSAASGDDAATSMNAMVDAMLQFGLVTGDSMTDAETSTRIINSLAASAQVGAAEIPQVADAILASGVAAKGANQSFDQMNAAIQVLAVGGKTGSEAGVALRNVMGLLQNASGPAEDALKSMGLTSKEMGESLNRDGLNAAMAKIGLGMNNLGSDAEKNAALMKIFGMENASAAGILIDNTEQYDQFLQGIIAGQEGIGAAFEQAEVRMDTAGTQTEIWKAKLNDAFIGLSQTMGQGITASIGFAGSIQPLVSTMAGLGAVIPTEKLAGLATTILGKVVPGLVTQTAATTAGAAAQRSFNLAALANPYILGIAAIVATVVALKALSDALHESAAEKLEDAKAEDELLNQQIKNTQARIGNTEKIKKSGDTLIDAFAREGDAAMNNTDLMVKLNMAFPGVINSSLSAAKNLEKLKEASNKSGVEIRGLKDELSDLALSKVDLSIQVIRLETNKIKEDMENSLTDALVDDATWLNPLAKVGTMFSEAVFGTSFMRGKAEDQMSEYTDAIYKASTDADLLKAGNALQLAISKGDGEFGKLTPEKKQELINQTQDIINNEMKLREEKANKIENLAKQQLAVGVSEVEVADMLRDTYGKTEEEIKAIINKQKESITTQADLTKEINASTASAADLGNAFAESMKKSKQTQTEAIGALSELNRLRREGSITEAQYQERRKTEIQNGKAATKEVLKLQKDQLLANNAILGVQQKQGESEYQLAKRKLDAQKGIISQDLKSYEMNAELLRLQEGREKSIIDEIALNDKKNESIEETKKKFQEIFGIVTDDKGKILEIGVRIGKGENKAEIHSDISKQWDSINNDFTENQIAALEIRAKIKTNDIELQEQLRALQDKQYEFEVSLGIRTPEDVLARETGKLETVRAKIDDINAQIDSFSKAQKGGDGIIDNEKITLEIQKLTKQLYDLQAEEIDITKITEEKKKELRMKNYELKMAESELYLQQYEETAKKEADIQALALKTVSEATNMLAENEKDKRLKALEGQKEAELITDAQYKVRAAEIEKEYQVQIAVIQEGIRAAELEAERLHTIAILEEKKKRVATDLKILDPIQDKDEYDALTKQLAEIEAGLRDKGDLIKAYSEELQAGLTESFSNLFSGDFEGAKDSAKKMLGFMAGVLKKQASLLATQKIIEQLGLTGGGIASFLLTPILSALVNAAIGKIIDPILGTITSFATGGRVDEPTLAIVGDAKKAKRNTNTEWIFRDDQLNMIMSLVIAKYLKEFNSMIPAITNRIKSDKPDLSSTSVNEMGKLVENNKVNYEQFNKSITRLNRSIELLPAELRDNLNLSNILKIGAESQAIQGLSRQYKQGLIDENDYIVSLSAKQRRIKSYARGSGFLYQPELAMVGDAGKNNPEIVLNSPLLTELMSRTATAANAGLQAQMTQVTNLLTALLEKDNDIYMDNVKVTDETMREMNRRKMKKTYG